MGPTIIIVIDYWLLICNIQSYGIYFLRWVFRHRVWVPTPGPVATSLPQYLINISCKFIHALSIWFIWYIWYYAYAGIRIHILYLVTVPYFDTKSIKEYVWYVLMVFFDTYTVMWCWLLFDNFPIIIWLIWLTDSGKFTGCV